jgi:hypothetical protein
LSVALWVGRKRFEIGSTSFLKSWFSTILRRLEAGRWGSIYPTIMRDFYGGALTPDKVRQAAAELELIQKGLTEFPPDQVVWDFENDHARPPWGDDISPTITSLANYFVTSDGKDLFQVLRSAFAESLRQRQGVTIS